VTVSRSDAITAALVGALRALRRAAVNVRQHSLASLAILQSTPASRCPASTAPVYAETARLS